MTAEALQVDETAIENAINVRGITDSEAYPGPCYTITRHLVAGNSRPMSSWDEQDIYDEVFSRLDGPNTSGYQNMMEANGLAALAARCTAREDRVVWLREHDPLFAEAEHEQELERALIACLSGPQECGMDDVEHVIEVLAADEDMELSEDDRMFMREAGADLIGVEQRVPGYLEDCVQDFVLNDPDEDYYYLALKGAI